MVTDNKPSSINCKIYPPVPLLYSYGTIKLDKHNSAWCLNSYFTRESIRKMFIADLKAGTAPMTFDLRVLYKVQITTSTDEDDIYTVKVEATLPEEVMNINQWATVVETTISYLWSKLKDN